MKDTPVVFLNGARQTGKTTLVRQIADDYSASVYFTLDDAATLAAATHDPSGFIKNLQGITVIDEVQKAPGLFPAIKTVVDNTRSPGQFLLTGSSNVLLLPRVSESLAGRMEIISLWPFSQGEINQKSESFIQRIFRPELLRGWELPDDDMDLTQRILSGGFPEAIARRSAARRHAWFGAYLTTVLQRDVRDLAHIEGLTDMPRLLALLASRTAGLLNVSDLSRNIGIPHTTLKRYLALFETTFLIHPLQPWHPNIGKRLVKASKLHLCDTGLLTYLLGIHSESLWAASPLRGTCMENFALAEIMKQLTWEEGTFSLWHFRTSAGREVDAVIESSDGRFVGIEIKASASVKSDDFASLRELAGTLTQRFVCGVVLYTGDKVLPFGDGFWALPIGSLWK